MTDPRRYPQPRFTLPPGATEVLLVRHGASAHALEGEPFETWEGHGDPPLAPVGREQAEAVGERLARLPIAGLFVTPLRRTAETAAPLAARTGLTPVVVPELVEVFLGEAELDFRIRAAKGDPLIGKVWAQERWDVLPGAEPQDEFAARVAAGLKAVVRATGPDALAVVVSHGGVIAELCHQATRSRPFAFADVDNGSISRLVVRSDGRRQLRGYNDLAHLDGPATAHPGAPPRPTGG